VKTADFDFELPPERIALRPMVPRDLAKLMVLGKTLRDGIVRDLPSELRKGDVLVFNDTKVIPAALIGNRIGRGNTNPKIEVLLHQRVDGARWKAFAKPARKLEAGDQLVFASSLEALVESKDKAGEITLSFEHSGKELDAQISKAGRMPLPPYIERKRAVDAQDVTDYQTIYAARDGAVAAPTAGLHFTPELMNELQNAGIQHEFVTLHVGAGTFLPVKTEDLSTHKMHSEWGAVSAEVQKRLLIARKAGGRIVCVGTTSLRLLETARGNPFNGLTDIFITPGYQFSQVDGLITNFHLPRSTLFMLVSAFAGTERMRAAYAHAIACCYRFYSYGDCSLLWPQAA
jgi:S-adenosylmethionine:tRNA ribosyltransferase-isomerase